MFKAERRVKIKALVGELKQVDVASLSKLLNVTEVTIRSDLEHLEQEGFLKRLHGGAVLNEEQTGTEGTAAEPAPRGIAYNPGKHRAAQEAVRFVEENDRIFLGAGETCYYIARELAGFKRLTVLTNNLHVAGALSDAGNIHLSLTGGYMVPGRQCVVGDIFKKTIEDLYVNRAFFSVAGVDLVAGYTVHDTTDVVVYREVSARSRDTVLVLDEAKFDTISFVKLDDLDLFPTVVCSGEVPAPYRKYYRDKGISLILPAQQTIGE